MLPTIRLMKQSFHRFNQEYFQGCLPTPEFKISKSSKLYGYCNRLLSKQADGTIVYRYVIACSKYFDYPLVEIENTMLHEMCHLWVYIYYPDTTEPSHGPIWQSIADRITAASNNKYIITPSSASCWIFINPKMLRIPKKSKDPQEVHPTTPQATHHLQAIVPPHPPPHPLPPAAPRLIPISISPCHRPQTNSEKRRKDEKYEK